MNNNVAEHVLVVGAGTTGISAFIELVEHHAAERIDIVDPGLPGLGMAFANTREELLCNTPAESMSLLAHDPDDFLNYLRERGIDASPNDCVPRVYVSQYTTQRYSEYCEKAQKKNIKNAYIADRVATVEKIGANRYLATLESGRTLNASHILICHGYGKPMVPEILGEHIGSPSLSITPYPEQKLIDSLKPNSSVLVLGTRLSAIDAALLLAKHGHGVTMASPSGEIPAVRTRAPDLTGKVDVNLKQIDFNGDRCHVELLREINRTLKQMGAPRLSKQICRSTNTIERLRAEIALAKQDSIHWQDILLAFLLQGNDMLARDMSCIPPKSLKKCLRMSTRYLSAIPVSNAEKMLHFLEQKQVNIIGAAPTNIVRDDQWLVAWGQADDEQRFDAIISAAGYTRPTLHMDEEKLTISPEYKGESREPKVSEELRICFPGEENPEKIWLVGVASYLRAPLVNGVFQATRQSEIVRRQLMQCC
ncbi:FAD-NAD(P)-binding [Thalassolituus maritimus]|uniref:FAD-NAD(P)-binding n=1 Tax=Thalassolituus maritimus TaxID=484498 RepID=A0A1N7Q9I9_9GAMM|nr:FAD/NAD(P)-binding protein [Thalassolituus maritimus]SIT19501.1 FAD-NAD(P)-binding [Thalassolituus maritimus]